MNGIKAYCVTVLGAAVVSFLLKCLLPEGNIKKYALYGLSVILTFCLVKPMFSVFNIDLPEIATSAFEYDYSSVVEATVQSISGFENADVKTTAVDGKISEIKISVPSGKTLENVKTSALTDYVKKALSEFFNIDSDCIFVEVV